jgi:hypothetical protein
VTGSLRVTLAVPNWLLLVLPPPLLPQPIHSIVVPARNTASQTRERIRISFCS